jgi:hypothetical protein
VHADIHIESCDSQFSVSISVSTRACHTVHTIWFANDARKLGSTCRQRGP